MTVNLAAVRHKVDKPLLRKDLIDLGLNCWLREGFRHRIVDSISECPSDRCTVRKSTPPHRHRVANVDRTLCSQKLSVLSSARSAQAFRPSKKSSFGVAAGSWEHKTACLVRLRLPRFQLLRQLRRNRNPRSLYAFGVQFQSGLWLTRTVDAAKFTLDRYVYITSCSLIPVIRKNSDHHRSSSLQPLKSWVNSLCSYISGSSSM